MKVFETREQVKIDDAVLVHTWQKSTDAIFIVRQIQETFRVKDKRLYYAFINLEKAFDRVRREVVRWTVGSEEGRRAGMVC